MLNAFASLKCSKKCSHNVHKSLMITLLPSPYRTLVLTLGFTYPLNVWFQSAFFLTKWALNGYLIHFKRPKLIFLHIPLYSCKDFNPVEFVRVIRFAEFQKKLGVSHVLASLIGWAIEKFDFKRPQLEGRENSIFTTSLEVNKPLGLFAFGNYLLWT